MGFIIGLLIGALAGYLGGRYHQMKIQSNETAEVDELRHARTNREAQAKVEKAGHIPSDLDVGPFLGDEAAEEAHREAVAKDVKEKWTKGRKAHFEYLLTISKNEDANSVIYYIAVAGQEEYLSNRSIGAMLTWGTLRVRAAIDYAIRNDYIKAEEKTANKGNRYSLKAKSLKQTKKSA